MKSLNVTTIYIVMLMFWGCVPDHDLLEERTPHLITSEMLYKNLNGFTAGVNGLYSLVREERSGGNNYMGANMMVGTDNVVSNWTHLGFEHIAQEWKSINNPSHGQYLRQFTFLYQVINSANTIINRAEGNDIDWTGGGINPDENKNRIIAEARALRAWAYRHLTYGWGDVPLSLEESSSSTIKTDWQRTPVTKVRDQIISDFEFAEKFIPVEPNLRGRLTKGAVQTYLAEMNLAMNNPERALYWADKAINTPEYRLNSVRYGVKSNKPGVPFMDMFYEGNENRDQGNSEALWVWQYAQNVTGGGGHNDRFFHNNGYFFIIIDGVTPFQLTHERGGRGIARMSLTKWAINLYEPQDDRGSIYAIRKFFILKNANENAPYAADLLPPGWAYGDTVHLDWSKDLVPGTLRRKLWPSSRKFDAGANPNDLAGGSSYNDLVYLRLAETYLLKAEAQYLLGDLQGAAETINVIRRRANATDISANDVNIDFILDESSRELVLEEDRRWTLLRTKKWLERTRKYNLNGGQFIAERDKLFPIPQAVIDANLSLPMTQNPGY